MSILGILVVASLCQGGWEPIPNAPLSEEGMRLASNPVEKVVLRIQDSRFWYQKPATSVWTGKAWKRVPTLPVPVAGRQEQVLAYDPVNKGILLFGGARSPSNHWDSFLNDTWLWKGGNWKLLGPLQSPSPRYYNSFATDTLRKRIVCWDGGDGTVKIGPHFPNEVWEWDGKTWNLTRTKVFPKTRWKGAMAFDPISRKTLLFGGTTGPFFTDTYLKDLWAWDGKAWKEIKKGSKAHWPTERGWTQKFVYFPKLKKCLLIGGGKYNQVTQKLDYYTDTWAWDGKTQTWSLLHPSGSIPGFPALLGSVAVDPVTQNLVLTGRPLRKNPQLNEPWQTWIHDGKTWKRASIQPAYPRNFLSVAWDPQGDRYLGLNGVYTYENEHPYTQIETWEFRHGKGWRKLQGPTLKRLSGSGGGYHLISHEASGQMLLVIRSGSKGETFLWKEQKKQWIPESRSLPGIIGGRNRICYDSKLKAVTYFGFDRYIYRWTPAKGWVKSQIRVPSQYYGIWQWDGWVAYDRQRDRFVLVRTNYHTNHWKNWEWDRKTWRFIPGLPGRGKDGISLMFLVDVPELGGLALVGGYYPGNHKVWWGNKDVFVWDGKTWKEKKWAVFPDFDPLFNIQPQSVFYDRGRREMVAFPFITRVHTGYRLRVGGLVAHPNFTRPGGTLPLELEERANAGAVFALAFSLSSWPGLPFLDTGGAERRLPIAADILFQQSLGWGMVGKLDSQGKAKIPIPVPAQKNLAGLDFYAAAILLNAKGVLKVSNELPLHVLR